MSTDTMATTATTIDIPALIKGLLARSDNPPDIEVDVDQLVQMLTTDDGKDAVYRMMQAEYRDRQDAAHALSTQAEDILSLKAQVATLTEEAEEDAEFASDIIKAICDHIGVSPEPEGYTAADLESLLEEHSAAISQDREAQGGQVVLAKEMAMEMTRAHDVLTTFVRESSDPGADALSSVWCMAQLIHKARSAGLLPADNRATPTQAPAESRSVVFTAPVALHTNTVTLIADFASALATKLRASEIKYGWTANWMRKGWCDELAAELLRHVHKGDPIDVAAYCAFAWFHGWSVAPAWKATHQHRKGGLYRVIARAELEADLSPVVVYESPEGRVWARPAAEFDDGRFTAISAPPQAQAQEGGL